MDLCAHQPFDFPKSSLQSFATDWKQALKDRNDQRRQKLQAERAVLIKDRGLTPELTRALKLIFSWYSKEPQQALLSANPQLNLVAASRLWYRCGIKLSLLDSILNEKGESENHVCFKDFVNILQSVVYDEEDQSESEEPCVVGSLGSPSFEVRLFC
jgi:hypothetical protein